MAIPRFARAFIKGAATAGVGMMAQKAKETREDEVTSREEDHALKLQNDRIKGDRATRIALLELKSGNDAKILLEKEENRLAKMRKQKKAEGFTEPMLDILQLQGYLDSETHFSVWFSKYDKQLPGMDWHLDTYIDSDTKEKTTFQEGYIKQWENYIGKQGIAQSDGSVFTVKESVVDSLKTQNGISDNTAKVVTSTPNKLEVVDPSIYEQGQIPGPIKGVDLSGPSLLKKETTDTQLSGKKTGSHWIPKEIRLYTNDDPNWSNLTTAPKNLNEGTELLLLTLDATTRQYVAKKVTYEDDFDAINAKIGGREKELVNAIYSRKFLLSENKDLAALVAKGGPQAVKEFFAQNEKNKKLFDNLYDFATMLDATYEGYLNKGPYDIVKSSVNLNSATNFDKGREITAEMTKLTNLNKTDAEKSAVLLQGINNVYSQVRNATYGLDKNIPEQRNLITRIQEHSLSRLRQNFAFNMIPDEKSGMMGTQSEEYKEGLRLFDTIMADIKLPEGKGNKGKYWITAESMEKGFEKIREDTKFKAPFIGRDESIKLPKTWKGGKGFISETGEEFVGSDSDVTGSEITGSEITGTIPSSIEDGVTTYDLSAIEGKTVAIPNITRSNKQNAISTAESITVKDADGNDLVLKLGDTIKVRNYTFQVSNESIEAGRSDLLNLKQLPYKKGGAGAGNPNKVLLDSKIESLNKIEKLEIPPLKSETDQENWIKRKDERITTLKKEIEELYNKIKG